jgi:predicted TIM-barrel enzyme
VCFDGVVRRSLPLLALSVGLAIGGLACSSDATTSSTAAATTVKATATTTETTTKAAASDAGPVASASPQLCQARDNLQKSVTDLASVDVVRNGTSAIKDQLATIRTYLGAVRSEAGNDVQQQADAFQTSLDSLQTALDASGTEQVTRTVNALRDVASTGGTLLKSLGNLDCP